MMTMFVYLLNISAQEDFFWFYFPQVYFPQPSVKSQICLNNLREVGWAQIHWAGTVYGCGSRRKQILDILQCKPIYMPFSYKVIYNVGICCNACSESILNQLSVFALGGHWFWAHLRKQHYIHKISFKWISFQQDTTGTTWCVDQQT